MPAIRGIDLSEGIRILGSGSRLDTFIPLAEFPTGTEAKIEQLLVALIQPNYEKTVFLSDYPPEDPANQNPPQLLINQRIEKRRGKNYLISTEMYVAIHVYSASPLRYTIKCQNGHSRQIEGEWWL
jgi:hypothetical protein